MEFLNDYMEKIRLVRQVFKGREEVYAKYNGTGFSPYCSNFNNLQLCPQKSSNSNSCKDCPHKKYVPLSDEVIKEHVEGKIRIGIYLLLPDNTCWFIAADLDNHQDINKKGLDIPNPNKDVIAIKEVCEIHGISFMVLTSKSGRGYHVYIFFEKPVPSAKARLVCKAILEEAGVINTESKTSFDRFSPIRIIY